MLVMMSTGIQVNLEPVATGSGLDLLRLPSLEASFLEGDSGALQLTLRRAPSESVLFELINQIEGAGVRLWDAVAVKGNDVWIFFTKAMAPLAILAVIAGILLVGLIIGWVLHKEIGPGGAVGQTLIMLALVAGGLLIVARKFNLT